MPLRGLRDLQFTVNYFNQIIDPLLLGVQLFSICSMEIFIWSVGGDRYWEVSGMKKNEAILILEYYGGPKLGEWSSKGR